MKKIGVYILVGIIGFLIAKWYDAGKINSEKEEDIQIVVQSIKNMSKLVVSEGVFSEIYSYKDAKKYFYETFEFNKSVIIIVNAKVQVMYDLEQMGVEIDSLNKRIIINEIPEEEIVVIPEIKYFDMQQSTFNTFTKEELNQINKKSIEKIKNTLEVTELKANAHQRLIIELSKIYQLSVILGWEVVDKTDEKLLDNIFIEKPKF